MRLNGWQRIGVIASAVWGIAGWLIGNSIGLHGGDLAESEFADCIASPITTGDACLAHFRTAYAAGIDGHWLTAAFWAVIPILLGWLAAWAIVGLTRWGRRGFQPYRVQPVYFSPEFIAALKRNLGKHSIK